MQKKFTKPSPEDITNYLTESKNYDFFTAQAFADRFWNFYESKGWVVGKSPMKSWQAAIRTWEINDKQKQNGLNQNSKLGTSEAKIAGLKALQ